MVLSKPNSSESLHSFERSADRRPILCIAMRALVSPVVLLAVISSVAAAPPAILLGYQDTLGQYSFGYSGLDSARSEVRTLDGSTRGSYSYVDGAGLIQSAEYTADGENGFRVAATNLPQAPRPVDYTPEVAAARAAHLQAVEQASQVVQEEERPSEAEIKKIEELKKAEAAAVAARRVAEDAATAAAAAEPTSKRNAELEEPNQERSEAPPAAVKPAPEKIETRAAAEVPEASVAPAVPRPVLIPISLGPQRLTPFAAIGATAVTPLQETITPAGTILKAAGNRTLSEEKEEARPATKAADAEAPEVEAVDEIQRAAPAFVPLNVLPLNYRATFSPYFRFAPLSYVTYNFV